MSRLHSPLVKAVTERRIRMARALGKRLREYGYAVTFTAWIDAHGGRLLLWELRVGKVRIMVRPVSHVMSKLEQWEYNHEPYPYFQSGVGEFDTLLRYLESVNR